MLAFFLCIAVHTTYRKKDPQGNSTGMHLRDKGGDGEELFL